MDEDRLSVKRVVKALALPTDGFRSDGFCGLVEVEDEAEAGGLFIEMEAFLEDGPDR